MESFQTIDLTTKEKRKPGSLMKRYWLFFGIAGVLVITGLISLYYRIPQYSATKISDKAFVAKANSVCLKYLPGIVEKQPDQDENLSAPATSIRVRASADSMKTMRSELGAIAVNDIDKTATNEWLVHWDSYIASGYQYADALAANNRSQYDQISTASQADGEKITAFALVNHMNNCQLRTIAPASDGI